MDTTQDINTVEWFFGYGGNHIGLKRVLPGLRLRAVCGIEESRTLSEERIPVCGSNIRPWPSRPGEAQHRWEPPRTVESKVDRDFDGIASGMGYAELCISCDNRTDELRLLGNGVCPPTAEKAFLVLRQSLLNEQ